MRFLMLGVVLATLTVTAGLGCSTADYQGMSPSLRTCTDTPKSAKDYYVGLNWIFLLGEPGERTVLSPIDDLPPMPAALPGCAAGSEEAEATASVPAN